MANRSEDRRGFLRGLTAASGMAMAAAPLAQAQSGGAGAQNLLPRYARAQDYKSLKQSSYDTTGGNGDSWPIAPGAVREVFNAARTRHHHAHLVHHCGPQRQSFEGNRSARILGRQRKAQRGSSRRRFLRVEPRRVRDLRIRLSRLFARQVAQLLLRDAVQKIGAIHRDQRKQASGGRVLFEYRLPNRSRASLRCPVLPRAVPPASAVRPHYGRGREDQSGWQAQLCVRRNSRPWTPHGRHHGRLGERGRLVGRRRRDDFCRRPSQASHQRHRLRRLFPGQLGFWGRERSYSLRPSPIRRAAHCCRRAHRRAVLLLSLAWRQPGDVPQLHETHHRARPRQRSWRQFLLHRVIGIKPSRTPISRHCPRWRIAFQKSSPRRNPSRLCGRRDHFENRRISDAMVANAPFRCAPSGEFT